MALHEVQLTPGEVIAGRYRIENVLGAGGMGVVYGATHTGLNQRVALKMLWPAAATDGAVVARFLREAQIAGQLTSEHVARVTDVGQSPDGSPFLVMEHLSGSNLSEILRARGPLPIGEVAGWILEACEGVAEAHSKGIVHRDLKPANLFLARRANGTAVIKVLDFGISKLLPTGLLEHGEVSLTATAAMMGSPRYMSPEQIRSAKRVDLRADLWSLGVTLYELTSGALPFSGESPFELLMAIVSSEPRPLRSLRPELPASFEQVVARCMEKDPDRRFAHAGELALALAPFAPGESAAMVPRIQVFSGLSPSVEPAAAPGLADLGMANTVATPPDALPPPGLLSAEGNSSPSRGATPRAPVALVAAVGALLALGAWRSVASPTASSGPASSPDASLASSTAEPHASSAPASLAASAPSTPAPSASASAPSAPSAPSLLVASAVASGVLPSRPPARSPGAFSSRNSIRDETRK